MSQLYVKICQEVEIIKAENETYTPFFIDKLGHLYQVILGEEKRYSLEKYSDTFLVDAISLAIDNFKIKKNLTPNGFNLKIIPPQEINSDEIIEKAKKLDSDVLKKEVEKRKRNLAHYKSFFDAKTPIKNTEKEIYKLVQDVESENAQEVIERIKKIRNILNENNIFELYWNDPIIAKSEFCQVDFLSDVSLATELPGLYSKLSDGRYALIGHLSETVRGKN